MTRPFRQTLGTAILFGMVILCIALSILKALGTTEPDAALPGEAQASVRPAACDLPTCGCLRAQMCTKVDPELAGSVTCTTLPGRSEQVLEPFVPVLRDAGSAAKRDDKRVSIAALVDQALTDQATLLRNKQAEMERWNANDQARFALWFGTTNDAAHNLVQTRIAVLLEINKQYALGNFRRAIPSRPGVFAYVHADDPTKIFLDMAFVRASTRGESSRAGTITHEMSHFEIAGGTQDHAYGSPKCKALARSNPKLALNNADNFEFYVENVR